MKIYSYVDVKIQNLPWDVEIWSNFRLESTLIIFATMLVRIRSTEMQNTVDNISNYLSMCEVTKFLTVCWLKISTSYSFGKCWRCKTIINSIDIQSFSYLFWFHWNLRRKRSIELSKISSFIALWLFTFGHYEIAKSFRWIKSWTLTQEKHLRKFPDCFVDWIWYSAKMSICMSR